MDNEQTTKTKGLLMKQANINCPRKQFINLF